MVSPLLCLVGLLVGLACDGNAEGTSGTVTVQHGHTQWLSHGVGAPGALELVGVLAGFPEELSAEEPAAPRWEPESFPVVSGGRV